MDTKDLVIAIVLLAVFFIIGILLCLGKCSFLLGMVRNMEDGAKKTIITRISGVILLIATVVLAVVVFSKAA